MKKLYLIPLLLLLFTGCGCQNKNTPGEHSERIEIVDWITPGETTQTTPVQIAVVGMDWQRTFPVELGRNWVIGLRERHGDENIIFYDLSSQDLTTHRVRYAEITEQIAGNSDARVLILDNVSRYNTNLANTLRLRRGSDIFIAMYSPFYDRFFRLPNNRVIRFIPIYTEPPIAVAGANLILDIDMRVVSQNLPQAAQRLGATTLVYFYDSSIPEDAADAEGYLRRPLIEASGEAGLVFAAVDIAGAIQCEITEHEFMTTVLPSLVATYGNDIVFVGLDNWRLFARWEMNDVIYLPLFQWMNEPTPTALASFLGIPLIRGEEATGTEALIHDIRTILDQQNRLGRIATWPMSMQLLFPLAAAEYGVMWANGSVPRYELDLAALEEIFARIIFEHTGEQLGVTLTQEGNRVLVLPDYLVY
ncbi:MAG: hypothetical protein FWC70_04275 [Defluviitaleaceae bacterium]|nr:hypothetical protein [Defluviitaleaceae bacterium]